MNLFCLPFSNASVERVFSAMALVKTNLRNRLVCETVEAVLSIRYGLKFSGVTASEFVASRDMLRSFNASIYAQEDDEEELMFEDVYAALDALES